jgi:threonyl-tRNA synthetase
LTNRYLGELEMWDKAEQALTDALNASGREWTLNPEGERERE